MAFIQSMIEPDVDTLDDGGGPLVTPEELPRVASALASGDASAKLAAVRSLRRLVSSVVHPPIQSMVDLGMITHLVACLSLKNSTEMQIEAGWVLTNVCNSDTAHVRSVVREGGIHAALLLCCRTADIGVLQQAIWMVGNIAGDSIEFRDEVNRLDAVTALSSLRVQRLIERCEPGLQLDCLSLHAWTIANCVCGRPPPPMHVVHAALRTLRHTLQREEEPVLKEALAAIYGISEASMELMPLIVEFGLVPRIIKLLDFPDYSVHGVALRIVGNLVSGPDMMSQALVDEGCVLPLKRFLSSSSQGVQKRAAWALSNILAGPPDHIQAVLDADVLTDLRRCLHDSDPRVQLECVWGYANVAVFASDGQLDYLRRRGMVYELAHALERYANDPRMVSCVLSGVEAYMSRGRQYGAGFEKMMADIEAVGLLHVLDNLPAYDEHGQQVYVTATQVRTVCTEALARYRRWPAIARHCIIATLRTKSGCGPPAGDPDTIATKLNSVGVIGPPTVTPR